MQCFWGPQTDAYGRRLSRASLGEGSGAAAALQPACLPACHGRVLCKLIHHIESGKTELGWLINRLGGSIEQMDA